LCVDTTRTFAVGFSGGGFFTHALACYGQPALTAIAVFQGGFEDGTFGGAANTVDFADCTGTPLPALIVHGEADTNVTPPYGDAAVAFWADNANCAITTAASALDDDCVEFDGCGGADVAYCTPAAVQHEVWTPEGPQVLDTFFRRYF
jgi:poly(3-hydroxybutyrate) depolymerase